MRTRTLLLLGAVLGAGLTIAANIGIRETNTVSFCDSCHAHQHATISWKRGPHFDSRSGVAATCVQCHLPPEGFAHVSEKIQAGARDVWATLTTNVEEIDWQAKSSRDQAAHHVFKDACLSCHQNLFARGLSKKGEDAHLHYLNKEDELRCINCHLEVGHEQPAGSRAPEVTDVDLEKYTRPAAVDSFRHFTETLPETYVSFEMRAIPAGNFMFGSSGEGPKQEVAVDGFWMASLEVSWQLYDTFYRETHGEGRSEDQVGGSEDFYNADAITGPTPPYGNPDQGWGKHQLPAITMSHRAARVFCAWLSRKTGKHYRLPTEAEWEYAARAGSENDYFFAGKAEDYSQQGLLASLFGSDTMAINRHIRYAANSGSRTSGPQTVKPNAFGLYHMLGNVREFCSDWYSEQPFDVAGEAIKNPSGPATGSEHVVRGGSFRSSPEDVRVHVRDRTRTALWLKTDPQTPKSLWWYSDCIDVGFRVVCDSIPGVAIP